VERVGDIAPVWPTEGHRPPLDRAIATLAERQHGVVALRQLRALGLSASAVRDRVRAGRLYRIHRAVYAVGYSLLTLKGIWMAAVLACEAGAVLSHRSAAAVLGLRPDNRPVTDVTTPRRGRHLNGVIRHTSQTLGPRDVSVVEGIPCTSVARTLLDIAEEINWQGLRRACNQAEILRVFDKRQIDDVLARADGRRGTPMLREVLAKGRIGEAITRNDLEEAFLSLCELAGLPSPLVNRWIPLDGGGVEADFLWPEHRLIVETDGGGTHDTPTAFEDDRRRDQRLMLAGYRVVRFTSRQVTHEPNDVMKALLALLAKAR
jgi:very-short-patch-repair endonuclease